MDPILKIEEERALFEADAVPYGFDITRSKSVTGEPWCEYREIEAGHRWGGWLACAELAAQTLASKEAEIERLKAALEKIANHRRRHRGSVFLDIEDLIELDRALNPTQGEKS